AALALANWNGNAWSYSVGTTIGACNGTAAGNITSVASQAENGIYSFVFYGNVTTQSITVCNGESYTIGNSTYTTSGTYVDVFTNTQNEDSTVITQLTVLEPITSTQSETICAGTSFTIGTNTFSFPGVYPVVLTSVDGCDSLVSLTLYVSEAIDLEVVQTGLTLKTNYLGTGYQWVNCSTNESIPGATNSQFTVTENGSYAVIIYDGFCVDTTACISFANVGLEEKTFSDWIHVYPNPCQGIVNVQWNSQITVHKLRVVDGTGRTIETISNGFQEATALQLHELTSGMYWLHFETDQGIQVVKFVVE
ncbi:MAG: T9SS type A sorting domain-containing protein, partial [Crocinitomicaceae bacterium]